MLPTEKLKRTLTRVTRMALRLLTTVMCGLLRLVPVILLSPMTTLVTVGEIPRRSVSGYPLSVLVRTARPAQVITECMTAMVLLNLTLRLAASRWTSLGTITAGRALPTRIMVQLVRLRRPSLCLMVLLTRSRVVPSITKHLRQT